uniref:Uncharacterized protein n=1 Tax=Oryza glumipatula TaxID=40148 RepID=A0A0D9ZKT8_9ORYZ
MRRSRQRFGGRRRLQDTSLISSPEDHTQGQIDFTVVVVIIILWNILIHANRTKIVNEDSIGYINELCSSIKELDVMYLHVATCLR